MPDTLLNVFLAIAVDNLANAQELTKVSLVLQGSDGPLVPLGARRLRKSALLASDLLGRPLLRACGQLEERPVHKGSLVHIHCVC